MKTAGIIAEYNPFHNGHAWQIGRLREQGFTHIAVAMGGNFLQRGSAALCEKHLRARMALRGGADLVVELPLTWACAPAQRFAAGGVALLDALGCVDSLAFGSECGDLSLLRRAARAAADPEVCRGTAGLLQSGITYAAARQQAVAGLYPREVAAVFAQPNNNLCVEYLRALEARHSPLEPLALPRMGAAHDSAGTCGGYASASRLRELLREGGLRQAAPFVPPAALSLLEQAAADGQLPAALSRGEAALLAQLRRMTPQDFSALPDLSEGLEHRLYDAARGACSLSEFLLAAKTKRYPLARLRRLTLAAFLGIRQPLAPLPPYLRVLGFNRRGRELLALAGQNARLPLSHSLARLEQLGGECAATAALEARSTDLYALLLPRVQPCGQDYRTPVAVEDAGPGGENFVISF